MKTKLITTIALLFLLVFSTIAQSHKDREKLEKYRIEGQKSISNGNYKDAFNSYLTAISYCDDQEMMILMDECSSLLQKDRDSFIKQLEIAKKGQLLADRQLHFAVLFTGITIKYICMKEVRQKEYMNWLQGEKDNIIGTGGDIGSYLDSALLFLIDYATILNAPINTDRYKNNWDKITIENKTNLLDTLGDHVSKASFTIWFHRYHDHDIVGDTFLLRLKYLDALNEYQTDITYTNNPLSYFKAGYCLEKLQNIYERDIYYKNFLTLVPLVKNSFLSENPEIKWSSFIIEQIAFLKKNAIDSPILDQALELLKM